MFWKLNLLSGESTVSGSWGTWNSMQSCRISSTCWFKWCNLVLQTFCQLAVNQLKIYPPLVDKLSEKISATEGSISTTQTAISALQVGIALSVKENFLVHSFLQCPEPLPCFCISPLTHIRKIFSYSRHLNFTRIFCRYIQFIKTICSFSSETASLKIESKTRLSPSTTINSADAWLTLQVRKAKSISRGSTMT